MNVARSALRQVVSLEQRDAGAVVIAAHDGSIISRRKAEQDGRLAQICKGET